MFKAVLLAALWLSGCAPPPSDVAPCADPVDGFGRLVEEGADRGVELDSISLRDLGLFGASFGGALAVEDLDGDGDLDAVQARLDGSGVVLVNDGSGHFDAQEQGWSPPGNPLAALPVGLATADLNGDRLPDLLVSSFNRVLVAWNEGGTFSAPETLIGGLTDHPQHLYASLNVGDPDGDGDVDLALPGYLLISSEPGPVVGAPDLVAWNDDGWRLETLLDPTNPSQSYAAAWTDHDLDGDQDLLQTTVARDPGEPAQALLHNEGGVLVDQAPELDADLLSSAMGLASADLNGDGLPDYCISDMGPLLCLLTVDGGYIEGGAGLGLVPDRQAQRITWSLELEDLDNDGAVDAVLSAGHSAASWRAIEQGDTASPDYIFEHPDAIWQGRREGDGLRFDDRSEALGFDSTDDHYGLATADFDGDGWLDLLVAGNGAPTRYWANRCGSANWLEVEFEGPEGNPQGWGAQVEVALPGGALHRELLGTRGYGQGPSRLHFGLGEEEASGLRVLWPDGAETLLDDVEPRSLVTVEHPG